MGLLDDAIREHLELKRRHGASAEEVERQEREALGAARGGEFATPAEAPDDVAAVAASDRPAAAEPADETRVLEDEVPPPVEDEVAPPAEPEVPPPGEEAAAPGYDEDPWLEDERDEVPREEALEPPPPPADEPAAEGEEDVLEETPEFLQETPEHERLWFEQRPPRDFDWDK